jgi:anthranilate 1,2-dioxygenase small subunit
MDQHTIISRAQAAHARCIDNNLLEQWPDFFTETCLYKITTLENHTLGLPAGLMHAFSRAMLIDRITALRQANIYERQLYRHIIGLPAILETDDAGRVRSETPFLVVRIMREGQTDLFATGRYLDLWDLSGERPLLAERVVVCDSSRIDTQLALPL